MRSGSTDDLGAGAQLSALIHSSPVAIYSISVDGTVTTWNRGAERTFGWTADEVIGRPLSIIPPEQAEEAAKLVRDLLPGRSITDIEVERMRKDGRRIIVSLSAGPVYDAAGALTGMIAVAVDTTERKRAEEELRASEASLRMAQLVAHLGSWELDLSTGRGRWSDEMFTLLRRPRERGTPALDEFYGLIHPDDLEPMKVAEGRIFRGETETEGFEYRSHPDLGPIRHFSAHLELFRDAGGRPERLVGTLLDITARREAEQEVERSERRYRELVENLEDVVYSVDAEGRFTYFSPAIIRLGATPDQFIGQPFTRFVHPDDLEGLRTAFELCLAGESVPFECRVTANGRTAIVRMLSRRVLDATGRVAGATGVMVDITRQRETEERLRLSQRLEALGRLAGGVAHDFNNLLTAIISYSDLALGAIGPAGRGWTEVQQIRRAGMRAAELTRQLLAFGRSQVLQPSSVSLNDVLLGMRSMLERILPEVELVLDLAPDLGRVRADPGQLEQVLVNLVVNARDATPQGGRITVSTRNAQSCDGDASPGGQQRSELVELTVTDTGMGMDEHTMDHVFEPFFSTKQPGQGTGLGLSIVYGIVEQSGGSVSVRSRRGEGATFTIHLPREADEARASSIHPGPPVSRTTGSETVLLVDDDAAVRGVAERILVALGYKVLSAAGPEAALLLCKEHPSDIDVLLTDVVMPGMRGPELASHCLAIRSSLVIVFMSGYADGLAAEKALLTLSRIAPIAKPFSASDLATKIRAALDARTA